MPVFRAGTRYLNCFTIPISCCLMSAKTGSQARSVHFSNSFQLRVRANLRLGQQSLPRVRNLYQELSREQPLSSEAQRSRVSVPACSGVFVLRRSVFAFAKLKGACRAWSVPAASQRFVSASDTALALLRPQGRAGGRARRVLARGSVPRARLRAWAGPR